MLPLSGLPSLSAPIPTGCQFARRNACREKRLGRMSERLVDSTLRTGRPVKPVFP